MENIMPVLFIGHGSPMNAVEDNDYSQTWKELGRNLPKPEAILSISAHWYTHGTRINDLENPRLIYDFYGFPKELYEIEYKAVGFTKGAHRTRELINRDVVIDNSWGIDHGTWSVLLRMYPKADIPVFQLSIDQTAPPEVHYNIGRAIRPLRKEGILIMSSGNVVHNLHRVNWDMDGGYPWALQFDEYIKSNIIKQRHQNVVDYHSGSDVADLAFRTSDHFFPLLYALGASHREDEITVFNNSCTLGSLSMTSYLFQ